MQYSVLIGQYPKGKPVSSTRQRAWNAGLVLETVPCKPSRLHRVSAVLLPCSKALRTEEILSAVAGKDQAAAAEKSLRLFHVEQSRGK